MPVKDAWGDGGNRLLEKALSMRPKEMKKSDQRGRGHRLTIAGRCTNDGHDGRIPRVLHWPTIRPTSTFLDTYSSKLASVRPTINVQLGVS